MQQYGDYTFGDVSGDNPDYSRLGKSALFTPRQLVDMVALAVGVGAAVACALLVLFG